MAIKKGFSSKKGIDMLLGSGRDLDILTHFGDRKYLEHAAVVLRGTRRWLRETLQSILY